MCADQNPTESPKSKGCRLPTPSSFNKDFLEAVSQLRAGQAQEWTIRRLTLRKEKSGHLSWWLVYSIDGARKRFRLGDLGTIRTEAAARGAIDEAFAEYGKDPQAHRNERRKAHEAARKEARLARRREADKAAKDEQTLRWFFGPAPTREASKYIELVGTDNRSAIIERARLLKLPDWLLDTPLRALSSDELARWQRDRAQQVKPITATRERNALSGALTHAKHAKLIPHNPMRDVKRLKVLKNQNIRGLEPEEEAKFLQALYARDKKIAVERTSGNRWRIERGYQVLPCLDGEYADHLTPMVETALGTGLRFLEARKIEWSDVDFKNGTLTIRAEIAKGKRTHVQPLDDHTIAVLRKWRNRHGSVALAGYVFPGKAGRLMDNCRKAFKKVAQSAGIGWACWHTLRHTYITKLARVRNIDIETVRVLARHSDLRVTALYMHTTRARMAAAVNQMRTAAVPSSN